MSQTEFDMRGSFIRWSDLPGRLPARVFIHGLGGTGWAAFGHIAGQPALGGHRSLVIDLPGHGLSDRPLEWGYSLDDHASAVAMVCAAAGVEGRKKYDLREWWVAAGTLAFLSAARPVGQRRSMPEH